MSKLRDYFFSDLNNVFFNTNEFSEEANVDGKTMNVVLDSELLKRQNLRVGEGLTIGELLFVARKIDFSEKPFAEKRMRFNNKMYRIVDLLESDDTYTITLAGYRS